MDGLGTADEVAKVAHYAMSEAMNRRLGDALVILDTCHQAVLGRVAGFLLWRRK